MTETTTRIPVVARRGIFLPECGLWLDPWDRQETAFVSHAHADHFASHGTIIASKGTARLIEARFRGAHVLEPHMFGRAWTHRGHRLRLLPAGHTLGSAQIHVTRLADGATLLYTGDFKCRTSRTSEPARFERADTLIMETTFGLPRYRFPSLTKVRNALIRFCRDCLEDGEVPVLVAYSLGKAQEVMAQLADGGFSWVLHPACQEMTQAYQLMGVALPDSERLDLETDVAGKVVLVPPNAARSQAVRRIKARRLALCTGWALTPGAKYRYQVDEVFPLSDHADYAELLEAVAEVRPSLVLTTHGYAAEFAADLRERGYEAWSLGADDQMEFSFGMRGGGERDPDDDEAAADVATVAPDGAAPADSEFTSFVKTADAVAATSGRLAKVALLADYFRVIDDDGKLALAARFLSGRAMATRELQKSLAIGWPVIRLALLEATGISAARLRELSASQADAGRTAYLSLLHGQKSVPRDLVFSDITAGFDRLLTVRGSMAKASVLATLFRQMTPAEGQYLVKILTGDMRIGLKEGLIEEALAAAFQADPSIVREAHMLTGDLGETARLARRGELHRACLTLFQPLKPMQPAAEPTAAAAWQRLTSEPSADGASLAGADTASARSGVDIKEPPRVLWVEEKIDGVRAQLHKLGSRVALFARDLRSLEDEFPEIAGPATRIEGDVLLDGEIVAVANGRPLDLAALQKRIGRGERDLFMGDDVPVRFIVFDLLYQNGESLLLRPLEERRARLEAIAFEPPFELTAPRPIVSLEALEAALRDACARCPGGVIVKDPASTYTAGRRGRGWCEVACPVVAPPRG